jgi:hypothetical protein
MVQKIDRQELQFRFLKAIQGAEYRFIEGLNPFHILLDGTEYWIYIKNLTSAHFENPDVWRAQLPQRDDFAPIKNPMRLSYCSVTMATTTFMPHGILFG